MIAARAFVIQKLPLRSKARPGGVGLHAPCAYTRSSVEANN